MRRTLVVAWAVALLSTVLAAPAGAHHGYNDSYIGNQWALHRIKALHAWHTSTGSGVPVAVIDTGVNYTHPDLSRVMHPARYDFLDGDNNPYDVQGHGTMVAGLVAAQANNAEGIAGVAPAAKVMAVRVGGRDPSDATVSGTAVVDGIIWAADHGAKVINLSLGANIPISPTPVWDAAVAYAFAKGAVIVAAAGNSASPFCGTPAFDPFVLCVGASDELDRRADFSNHGLGLDIVAPGTRTLTTTNWLGYASPNGTSMASPIAAGVAAMLVQMGATNAQAMQILKATAVDLGTPGWDLSFGFGRLNAKAAVDLCTQICVR